MIGIEKSEQDANHRHGTARRMQLHAFNLMRMMLTCDNRWNVGTMRQLRLMLTVFLVVLSDAADSAHHLRSAAETSAHAESMPGTKTAAKARHAAS